MPCTYRGFAMIRLLHNGDFQNVPVFTLNEISGCDYYPQGLRGVGIKTGIKICGRAFSDGVSTMADLLKKKEKYFSAKMLDKWDNDTIEKIIKAEETFSYQVNLEK